MAWTAPMTAVANDVFTAAQFNAHVRDNFLETAPAKATTAGSIFVGTAANAIAERIPQSATVATGGTVTATAYGDPATGTVGPAVTATSAATAIVFLGSAFNSNTADKSIFMGYDISGASTIAAADARALCSYSESTGTGNIRIGRAFLQTGLTPGANTFTAKYKINTSGGTHNITQRDIIVIPL